MSVSIKILKSGLGLFFAFVALAGMAQTGNNQTASDTTVNIQVNAGKVTGQVNKNIYGDLLEHIYHSVNGGLWGEMLASRSFEPEGSHGWNLNKSDDIVSAGTRTSSLFFGDSAWTNYVMTGEVLWEPYFVGVPAPWSGGRSDIRFIFRNGTDSLAYAFHLDAASESPFKLEKITTTKQGSKTIVLKSVASSAKELTKPRLWHRFKIICKGAAIAIFIDDREVLTYLDGQTPLLNGKVGLLLTKTTAKFKNLKVIALDGKILWAGLPDEVKPNPVAPDWLSYGKGIFELSKATVINGAYAQKITVNGGIAGVQQTVFNLKAGENYNGSVWCRGDKGLKFFACFMNEGKMLAKVDLGFSESQWKKYNFKLTPSASSPKAELVLGVEGAGSAWFDQASLVPESAEKIGGFRPDLYNALNELQPTHLRWPGGSYASGYHWKWGIGLQEGRTRLPKASWDDFDQNSFGTDQFLQLCKKLGSEPVIVIRIGYDQPDAERPRLIKEAQEWLEYCNGSVNTTWGKIRAQNGHPQPYHVKYWEIDNEMWEMGVEKYGKLLREFVPALKKIDPSIKIIACGDFTEKGENRDSILFNTSATYFDYISLHHYESPARYQQGPVTMAKKYKAEEKLIAASANPAIKLYISEWNASETDWRTGLYAGGILNVFEKDTHIAMAAAALLLRRTDASGWNNAFINFDNANWFPAPNYVVTKLYREHYAPSLLELNGNTGQLNIVATSAADGSKIIVKTVNPSNTAIKVNLDISNFKPSDNAVLYLLAPGSLKARNTMEQPGAIAPVRMPIKNNGNGYTYVLPGLSVGVLEVNK